MKIRKQQMIALQRSMHQTFEDEMVAHLGEFSPALCKTLEEDQLRTMIRLGVERAQSHGFTFRGPVRLYLETMMLFGSHFDTDPQYPWLAEILTGQDVGPEMQRAIRLYDRILDFRRKVAGPDDAYTLDALRKISVLARRDWSFTSEDLVSSMLGELTLIYPERAAYAGESALEALIRKGIAEARDHRFAEFRDLALFVVLMLAFGHGCADDPLYPWIARTLRAETITDPKARARRLEKKALTWLEQVLASFREDDPT